MSSGRCPFDGALLLAVCDSMQHTLIVQESKITIRYQRSGCFRLRCEHFAIAQLRDIEIMLGQSTQMLLGYDKSEKAESYHCDDYYCEEVGPQVYQIALVIEICHQGED